MSQSVKHVPQHRAAPAAPGRARPVLRTTVALSALAVLATGAAVTGGISVGTLGEPVQAAGPAAFAAATTDVSEGADGEVAAAELGDRAPSVSRSDRRDVADPEKVAALEAEDAPAMTATESLSDNDPRDIAQALLPEYGFSSDQFSCLDSLWTKESGWSVTADNPTSSAYGIPQSLPGSKMATVGADWATNPETQIRWGLGYIQGSYGSPCAAWDHSQAMNWY